MRPIFAALLLFAIPAIAAEWSGFQSIKLGAPVSVLGPITPHPNALDTYTRHADRETLPKLGLAEVTYEIGSQGIQAIELVTSSKSATETFLKSILSEWGEPVSRSAETKTLVWLGETNQLELVLREDGTARMRLTARPAPAREEVEQPAAVSELERWADEDMAREAKELEEQRKRDEAAAAEARRIAEMERIAREQTEELARQQRLLLCGSGTPVWGTIMQGPNQGQRRCVNGGSVVPNGCCA